MPPLDLILTIDTEFSIAGAFTDPARCKPVADQTVLGRIEDRENGLGFILDTLKQHGATATFFVEVMNTIYFGTEAMGKFAKRIREAGHDVQLHVHPCWLAFKSGKYERRPGQPPPSDACAKLATSDMVALLETGITVFEQWGMARPVALRTGGFSTARQVYTAQRLVGIPLASNLCIAVAPPEEPELRLRSGRHLIEGVVEVPALSFVDRRWRGREHLRPLQITATSEAEQRLVLTRAYEAGMETIVAVTHPFEFFKRKDQAYTLLRRDRINQTRLGDLCRFVAQNPEKFRWTSFAARARQWIDQPTEREQTILGSPALAALRMAENALNDKLWRL